MGWERRGNKSYYYCKYSLHGKTRSMYLGKGDAARLFATMVANRRDDRATSRQLRREEQQELESQFDAAEQPVLEFK
jgi:hypothetical protein